MTKQSGRVDLLPETRKTKVPQTQTSKPSRAKMTCQWQTKDFILTSGRDNLSLILWSSHKLNASWVMVIQYKAYTMSRLRKPMNFTAKTLDMEFICQLATNFTVNGFCCVQQSIMVMQQHIAQYNLHFQYSIQTQTHLSSAFPGINILLVSHAADRHSATIINGGLQKVTNGILQSILQASNNIWR